MALKEVKVLLANLKPGMYVSRLDRPWRDAPYPLQGFFIHSQEDIDKLLEYCDTVIVDVARSSSPKDQKRKSDSKTDKKNDMAVKQSLIHMKPKRYKDTSSRKEELVEAEKSYRTLSDVTSEMLNNIVNNKKLDMPQLKKAVNPMIDSVLRNPDAYAWLTRLKHADNYTYNHSICCAVWAVAFGRHLGMPRKDLQSLALGALLFDVGKMKLPEKLINNPKRFNNIEFKIVKKHVEHSLEILAETDDINEDVYNMIKMHHERHNGSGYPDGLKGDQINIYGKIAGLVDCYDAMISERVFASPLSPHDAVKKFYEWRNIDFQSELVEQFIQIVGIYPVGTLVELSNGMVGVIVNQHRVWRLRPQIMLLLNGNKEALDDFKTIDLFVQTIDEEGESLDIVKSVEPGMYGIDPDEFYI
jgi:putative nucleotidyltransferase with HDIG domain